MEVSPELLKEFDRIAAKSRKEAWEEIDKAIRRESHIPIRIKHVDKKEKKK